MTYWDTSALLKLYVLEKDSAYFRHLVSESSQALLTADIAKEEVLCTLYRKEFEGDLQVGAATTLFATFEADIQQGRIVIVSKGADVLAEAKKVLKAAYAESPPLFIRSLDAIHVASALSVKAATLVATDKRLRETAELMGLNVLPE